MQTRSRRLYGDYPTAGKSGKRTPEQSFASLLKRKYNMTVDEYNTMVEVQKGLCLICDRPPRGNGKTNMRLHIDHCHNTGTVRGLLCQTCNVMIGLSGDDPEILNRAVQYLLG